MLTQEESDRTPADNKPPSFNLGGRRALNPGIYIA